MSQNGPSLIDARYPPQPIGVRRFMAIYPAAIIGAAVLGLYQHEWAWWISAFTGVGWIGVIFTAFTQQLHREGYDAALTDLTWARMDELGMEGKLPPDIQRGFDSELAKRGMVRPPTV